MSSNDATLTGAASHTAGMTPLDLAVAAQRSVNAAAEEHRRCIAARDQAVCDAYADGSGRTTLAREIGVSVSTIDHILDRRRCA